MSWLGMSIPTLPGTSRRPRPMPPGTKNIERKKEIEQIKPPNPIAPVPTIKPIKAPVIPAVIKPIKKPSILPGGKPEIKPSNLPEIKPTVRKTPPQKPKTKAS